MPAPICSCNQRNDLEQKKYGISLIRWRINCRWSIANVFIFCLNFSIVNEKCRWRHVSLVFLFGGKKKNFNGSLTEWLSDWDWLLLRVARAIWVPGYVVWPWSTEGVSTPNPRIWHFTIKCAVVFGWNAGKWRLETLAGVSVPKTFTGSGYFKSHPEYMKTRDPMGTGPCWDSHSATSSMLTW